jgi:hypothetical protein
MAETLASRIRAKFPGVYDGLDDDELETRVLRKYPQYEKLANPMNIAKAQTRRDIDVQSEEIARGMAEKPQSFVQAGRLASERIRESAAEDQAATARRIAASPAAFAAQTLISPTSTAIDVARTLLHKPAMEASLLGAEATVGAVTGLGRMVEDARHAVTEAPGMAFRGLLRNIRESLPNAPVPAIGAIQSVVSPALEKSEAEAQQAFEEHKALQEKLATPVTGESAAAQLAKSAGEVAPIAAGVTVAPEAMLTGMGFAALGGAGGEAVAPPLAEVLGEPEERVASVTRPAGELTAFAGGLGVGRAAVKPAVRSGIASVRQTLRNYRAQRTRPSNTTAASDGAPDPAVEPVEHKIENMLGEMVREFPDEALPQELTSMLERNQGGVGSGKPSGRRGGKDPDEPTGLIRGLVQTAARVASGKALSMGSKAIFGVDAPLVAKLFVSAEFSKLSPKIAGKVRRAMRGEKGVEPLSEIEKAEIFDALKNVRDRMREAREAANAGMDMTVPTEEGISAVPLDRPVPAEMAAPAPVAPEPLAPPAAVSAATREGIAAVPLDRPVEMSLPAPKPLPGTTPAAVTTATREGVLAVPLDRPISPEMTAELPGRPAPAPTAPAGPPIPEGLTLADMPAYTKLVAEIKKTSPEFGPGGRAAGQAERLARDEILKGRGEPPAEAPPTPAPEPPPETPPAAPAAEPPLRQHPKLGKAAPEEKGTPLKKSKEVQKVEAEIAALDEKIAESKRRVAESDRRIAELGFEGPERRQGPRRVEDAPGGQGAAGEGLKGRRTRFEGKGKELSPEERVAAFERPNGPTDTEWISLYGGMAKKAKRAWLESKGKVPGAEGFEVPEGPKPPEVPPQTPPVKPGKQKKKAVGTSAKPGPKPTPPEEVESALRASVEGKGKKIDVDKVEDIPAGIRGRMDEVWEGGGSFDDMVKEGTSMSLVEADARAYARTLERTKAPTGFKAPEPPKDLTKKRSTLEKRGWSVEKEGDSYTIYNKRNTSVGSKATEADALKEALRRSKPRGKKAAAKKPAKPSPKAPEPETPKAAPKPKVKPTTKTPETPKAEEPAELPVMGSGLKGMKVGDRIQDSKGRVLKVEEVDAEGHPVFVAREPKKAAPAPPPVEKPAPAPAPKRKPISTQDPAEMTPAQINKELDTLGKRSLKHTDEMLAQKRGNEKFSETAKKDDPLSKDINETSDRKTALHGEIKARMGPSAPSRMPLRKGFGRRKKPREESGGRPKAKGADEVSESRPKDLIVENKHEAGVLDDAVGSGRYIVSYTKKKSTYGGNDYEVHLTPTMPKGVKPEPPMYKGDTGGKWYDPAMAEPQVHAPHKLKKGWAQEVSEIAKPQEGSVFRGMSAEEWRAIQKTGKVESRGGYNLGEAETGKTFYSVDADQAGHYAAGFQPWQRYPTHTHPAYVIEIRNPGRKGTIVRGDERGIPGSIDAVDIVAVYEGVPYYFKGGKVEYVKGYFKGHSEGARYSPSTSVAWRKAKAPKAPKKVPSSAKATLPKTGKTALHGEIKARMGPSAPSRMPLRKGFGRRKKTSKTEVSGASFGDLYHGGKAKIESVDPAKLQSRDSGFYGKGFYLSETKSGTKGYGGRVSTFRFKPDARILVSSLRPQDAPPGLLRAVKSRLTREGLEKARARGKEKAFLDEMEMIESNHLEWKGAVDRYAELEGFDAVRYTAGEVVVKNTKALERAGQKAKAPKAKRAPKKVPSSAKATLPKTGKAE